MTAQREALLWQGTTHGNLACIQGINPRLIREIERLRKERKRHGWFKYQDRFVYLCQTNHQPVVGWDGCGDTYIMHVKSGSRELLVRAHLLVCPSPIIH